MPTIPGALREARKRRNMTQGDLAYMSGVAVRTIRTMEREGGADVMLDGVLRVCGVLRVPLGSVIRHPDRSGPWLAN